MSGAWVDNYAWYCVTRFFAATGAMGSLMCAFVLAVELAGPKTKSVIGINFQAPFALGETFASLLGIWVKDWRDYHVKHTS